MLQEALREATRGYQIQKQAAESGRFASLSPEARDDFEKVWRDKTMELRWTELSAPPPIEEHLYYPVHKRMKSDYIKTIIHRRYAPDTTKQAVPSADAPLRLAPLDLVDPLIDPAMRTEARTLWDIVAHAKAKYCPQDHTLLWQFGCVRPGGIRAHDPHPARNNAHQGPM